MTTRRANLRTLIDFPASLVLSPPRDPEIEAGLTPDPGDDYLIALAGAAGAHFIVSGDPHLTELRQAKPPALTPRAFSGD